MKSEVPLSVKRSALTGKRIPLHFRPLFTKSFIWAVYGLIVCVFCVGLSYYSHVSEQSLAAAAAKAAAQKLAEPPPEKCLFATTTDVKNLNGEVVSHYISEAKGNCKPIIQTPYEHKEYQMPIWLKVVLIALCLVLICYGGVGAIEIIFAILSA